MKYPYSLGKVEAFSSQRLNDETLALIGRVAVESAGIEANAELMIAGMFDFKHVGKTKILLGNVMLGTKLNYLSDLGKIYFKNKKRKLETLAKLVSNAKIANEQRKIAIHGIWSPDGQTETTGPHAFSIRDKKKKIDIAALKKMAEALAQSNIEMTWFMMAEFMVPKGKNLIRSARGAKPQTH